MVHASEGARDLDYVVSLYRSEVTHLVEDQRLALGDVADLGAADEAAVEVGADRAGEQVVAAGVGELRLAVDVRGQHGGGHVA